MSHPWNMLMSQRARVPPRLVTVDARSDHPDAKRQHVYWVVYGACKELRGNDNLLRPPLHTPKGSASSDA